LKRKIDGESECLNGSVFEGIIEGD
jgi:hypothetical protein